MAISFKGAHFPQDIILMGVRWYVAYPLSYRHVEELMEERGVPIDHATIQRWVVKYRPQLEEAFHRRKRPVRMSWRMDETFIKVKGQWYYLYRTGDKTDQTIDFLLTEQRDERAAMRFLTKAIRRHGVPEKITIDGSAANEAAIKRYNEEHGTHIIIRQVKYLNNIVEQDHRGIKRITRPMLGFKAFEAAQATLVGIELMHMIKKRQLVVEYQLPGREVIPTQARFSYNKPLDLVEAKPRAPKEIAKLYESVVSQIALRTLREVFAVQADGVVDTVVFNGHVSTKDPATGQPRYPCIVSVAATREQFSGLVLTDVTPRETLRHLNALVSPHPFDLEAVRPVLEFDLTKYKFVDEIDMIAGLDGRLDLLELTPTEFEHLVRQLFEEIGMQAWVTQASRDDGVDAVAINPDPIVGGLCIVQAKRYTGVVSTESVRALGGVMDDKRAAKGVMVTTSWYGKESWEFAARHGRIELIDGPRLKHLLKERVGLDVLISLPRRAAKTT